MEFAYLTALKVSVSAARYKELTDSGQREKKADWNNEALLCGSCGSKAFLRRTPGANSYVIFAAHHQYVDEEPCPESSHIGSTVAGIITDTRQGTRSAGATIAPRKEDPLRPTPAPVHVQEEALTALEDESYVAHGRRTHRDENPKIVDRDRLLLPKTILSNLLADRHRFDDCVFSMPVSPKWNKEFMGLELIREIGELTSDDEGKYRYVWGNIHNTHTYTPPEPQEGEKPKASKIFLNTASQNNKHLPSSVVLMMQEKKVLAEHFLGTLEDVACKNVWFIAYGKVVVKNRKNQAGYSILVYENWQLHILTKRISEVISKQSKPS